MKTYQDYKDFFMKKANTVVNGFVVDKENDLEVELAVLYMMRDKKFEEMTDRDSKPMNLCLDRGICLLGSVGTGKTELMRTMQRCLLELKSPMAFQWTTPWQQANFWQENSRNRREISRAIKNGDWMFDELGMKEHEKVSDYGRQFYMGELIVHESYENFRATGAFKHFTTNLTLKQVASEYTDRVKSRIERMCNIIPMIGKDRSKMVKPKERQFEDSHFKANREPSEQDRIKIKIDFMEECFIKPYEVFVETENYLLPQSHEPYIYDELEKLNMICLSKNEKTQIYQKAKQEVLDETRRKFFIKETDKRNEIKSIEEETDKGKEKIIAKSKVIVLRTFVKDKKYKADQMRDMIYKKIKDTTP